MKIPSSLRRVPRGGNTIERELHHYSRSLSPAVDVVDRLRTVARSSYGAYVPEFAGRAPSASSPMTFLGQRRSGVLLGLLLFAATFGDIRLCAGLSMAAYGLLMPAASDMLGAPFLAVAALVAILGAFELLFAFGVWARRDWARPLGLITESVAIASSTAWALAGAALPLQLLTGLVSFVMLMALFVDGVPEAMASGPRGVPRQVRA